jgi:putative transcriptional regulator
VLGLILNRRSKVPISRVLDGLAGAKDRPDPVYAGGPVERSDVLALVRSRRAPGDAKRVLGDVFLVSTKETLEKTFASATDADSVHVYLGYSGWTAPQLQHELDLGAWYIFPGSAKAVFDSEPDALWPQLIRETEMQIARRGSTVEFRPIQ